VWAADVTFIPMPAGFAYLVAVLDVFSRRVLAWRLSNTMEARFCVEALNEALGPHGVPEVFTTDQGSQFTSRDFTGVLEEHGVAISVDGRGRHASLGRRAPDAAYAGEAHGEVPFARHVRSSGVLTQGSTA
jgi:putative transposase